MKRTLVVLSIVVVVLLGLSVFVVPEGRQAIVLQFGEVVTSEPLKPGLHFKIPFINNVVRIDTRILDLSSGSIEVIAADQKRLIVSYYAKYRITDPVQFYRSAKSITNLESRLSPVIESNMREQVGLVPLIGILTEERGKVMSNIKLQADKVASDFGVEVVDVRIKRADLPGENSEAIFKRMQTEREKEAREIRAQGYQEAQRIISTADKEKKLIITNAYSKAQSIKGEGDAEAAKIYSIAYMVDQEFYKFYRSLIAYERVFEKNNTRFIINSGDRFLSILKDSNEKK
ncbi:hflC protein [Neorickettsia helminthoeca str. Oregon]|uniref:Protein HflC n=1 Tax=Neorickettsia helminthoeca str. Oregon TaxID=1286528 RepID=X5H3I6_9RICK|nr:protease modulator HflC [Neorickettsia helminthoeca]AHX11116.1 hflC protein [Neorickettsia helminthoeca str. Oregon]